MSNDSLDGHRNAIREIFEGKPAEKFVDEWRLVDKFTVRQAAHLWAGVEPIEKYSTPKIAEPKVYQAIRQMLVTAIGTGAISVRKKNPHSKDIDDDDEISREDLKSFAKSKEQYPAFIFNTNSLAEDGAKTEKLIGLEKKTNPGGAPRQYDWDKARIGLAYYSSVHGTPESLAKAASLMARFIQNGYSFYTFPNDEIDETGTIPDQRTVEKQISTFYKDYAALEASEESKKGGGAELITK